MILYLIKAKILLNIWGETQDSGCTVEEELARQIWSF